MLKPWVYKPITEPLKITAHLTCGVICDRFLPIDALLYYQLVRESRGEQPVTFPGRSASGPRPPLTLPVRQINPGQPDWYYAASFAQWPEHTIEGTDHWNKRLDVSLCDLIDMQGRRGNIPISGGRYRSYHMPVFYRHAVSVSWFLVGKRGRIEQLLATAFGLGKKTSMGWGQVKQWDVEPWPEDWSIRGPGGKLMRGIPAEGGMLYGVRPSYWDPRHQYPCEMPQDAPSHYGLTASN